MAKASIKKTCADCGTEYWAQKACINRAEAARWEAWMAQQEGCCPDCYKARQAAQREAEAQKCEEALDLPSLTGTEKQIAWARRIRKEAIDSALARQRCQGVEHLTAQSRPLVAQAAAALPNASKWWIDTAPPEIARMILHGIRCAQYAQMDDARRARVAAATGNDTQRRDIALYERARIAGRTYAEQVAADEAEAREVANG